MYVFPVLRWLKVFSQTWEGDVTMVLPSSFMQLKKSVTNPTNKDLLDACKQVASGSCIFCEWLLGLRAPFLGSQGTT